ncbi:MAG TPA: hypothetical protein VMH33_11340 [Solirubrobacterales bacterium]|nr:hypothetical protein [Solirubrobacterales bacterium]
MTKLLLAAVLLEALLGARERRLLVREERRALQEQLRRARRISRR